ncbi:MAG: hypothetical protein ACFFDB_00110 [Promethearchaeota archaeon]
MEFKDFKRIFTLTKKGISTIPASSPTDNPFEQLYLKNRNSFYNYLSPFLEEKKKLAQELKNNGKSDLLKLIKENSIKWDKKTQQKITTLNDIRKYTINNLILKSLREDAHSNRFNQDYLPEKLLNELKLVSDMSFLEKYPFLQKYSPLYPAKYKKFIDSLDYYEEIELSSKRGGINIKMELFNIKENEIYFPNKKLLYSIHSALHSIDMVLSLMNGKFKNLNDESIFFYTKPLFSHIGDREYVLYFISELKLPLVVLTRTENLSYILMSNGLPKRDPRYCTRIFKLEPASFFYTRFFYPYTKKIKYLMTVKEIMTVAEENNIDIPKSLKKKKEIANYVSKVVNEKNLIPPNTTIYSKFEIPGQKIKPKNIVELLGITRYQSVNRSKLDPDVKLKFNKDYFTIEDKEKYIYGHLPIFDMRFEEMKKIFENSGLRQNPYELDYVKLKDDFYSGKKEVRMGCIMCPFKDILYYKFLRDNFPDRYFYANMMRVVASAKNIIRSNKEYFYFDKDHISKKYRDYKEEETEEEGEDLTDIFYCSF